MKTKEKKQKVKKTPKQKFMKFLKVLGIIALVIVVIIGICAALNAIGNASNRNFVRTIAPVKYDEQLEPEKDAEGNYTFVTDRDFKVMQLTDVHIGAGIMCAKKDSLAINAVAAMVSEEKPDLVIVTGDMSYPVPFQAGTFNNRSSAVIFAELMERLGVYWAPAFGNHDTEAYSFFSREYLSKMYMEYPHCLLQTGPDEVDGFCNYVINVKKTTGEITQSLFMLDSHSYVDNDYFGILWKYDTIHENQVQWYENTLKSLQQRNGGVMPKSLAFFHIPLPEYRTAWEELVGNKFKDTDNVKYIYGMVGENAGDVAGVFCSEHNYGFFDKAEELGSTKGIFCGHDHLNNFCLDYKGIKLCYGYSVDYLAYPGIIKFGLQRGCTIIDIRPDGSFDNHLENYYQDKYVPVRDKGEVSFDDMKEDIPLKSADAKF